ncbi:MAG: transposase, partial [Gammaproteobacteria bacterium]|nr:transposase [Gammaproteobacteria bacterium]
MPIVLNSLPNDVKALKRLITQQAKALDHLGTRHDQLQTHQQATIQQNKQLEVKVSLLQEQLNLALARRYAASSEKLSPDQIRLFDEAEVEQASETDEVEAVAIIP